MAELVDAPDLGSGAARCESSSLSVRTSFLATPIKKSRKKSRKKQDSGQKSPRSPDKVDHQARVEGKIFVDTIFSVAARVAHYPGPLRYIIETVMRVTVYP